MFVRTALCLLLLDLAMCLGAEPQPVSPAAPTVVATPPGRLPTTGTPAVAVARVASPIKSCDLAPLAHRFREPSRPVHAKLTA